MMMVKDMATMIITRNFPGVHLEQHLFMDPVEQMEESLLAAMMMAKDILEIAVGIIVTTLLWVTMLRTIIGIMLRLLNGKQVLSRKLLGMLERTMQVVTATDCVSCRQKE